MINLYLFILEPIMFGSGGYKVVDCIPEFRLLNYYGTCDYN